MKIALCAFPIYSSIRQAFAVMQEKIIQAVSLGCALIVFPEACLSGLDISGVQEKDTKLSLAIDSRELNTIRELARKLTIHICFGFLELVDDKVYDSAVLIDDRGQIVIHYRRISPGWLLPGMSEEFNPCGDVVEYAQTVFGKTAILVCGDLFYPSITDTVTAQKPDLTFHIMARAYPVTDDIQQRWETQELPYYTDEWAKLGGLVLSVNAIETFFIDEHNAYCGGAWVYSATEGLLASHALLEDSLFVHELP
ncbi:MAG: carbon-nitrogen hydrolase family protein [Candidatus Cloacimonadaceae bacterium]|nr:carbon-nitrogen hydrolase family protein [Candidatus Cloacimonadaceae bacterium]